MALAFNLLRQYVCVIHWLCVACEELSSFCSIHLVFFVANRCQHGSHILSRSSVLQLTSHLLCRPPLCYDFSPIANFLNKPSTRAALGVGDRDWSVCNFYVNGMFSGDWMKDYQQDIPDLLANGTRVMIYAGDVDFICNWIGNKNWVLDLPWSGQAAFDAAADKYAPTSARTAHLWLTSVFVQHLVCGQRPSR